jgi:pimeloyl-ACP methyl ester carboxylesterase
MKTTVKKIGRGLLWGLGGVISALIATIAGWIIFSRKYIAHDLELDEALDADRKDFQSKRAGRLSYYVDKTGQGRPLVLLHSVNAAASAYEMKPIFDHFRGNRPVYALDLPGYGFSNRASRLYRPQLYQNAITEFLQDVVGEGADLVALSLSCEFAALAAAHEPDIIRSLVMISPTGFSMPKTGRLSQKMGRAGDTLYTSLAVPLWNRPFFDLVATRPSIHFFLNQSFEGLVPQEFVDYAYQTAHQPGAQFAPTYFLSGKLFTPAVRETVYNVLDMPVLVIYDRDAHTNFAMLPLHLREKASWQATRVTPTKGLPHWEKPERTFDVMKSFWEGI